MPNGTVTSAMCRHVDDCCANAVGQLFKLVARVLQNRMQVLADAQGEMRKRPPCLIYIVCVCATTLASGYQCFVHGSCMHLPGIWACMQVPLHRLQLLFCLEHDHADAACVDQLPTSANESRDASQLAELPAYDTSDFMVSSANCIISKGDGFVISG
ncbi:hypothetical protein ERJ75_001497200 [Trypanosoma vivax]|nr:hypothetical protein ERJ75_001497200 [Trypanosoma vivax]